MGGQTGDSGDKECTRCGLREDEHRIARGSDCGGYVRDEGAAAAGRARDAFGDGVQALVRAMAPHFLRASVLGVRVSEELGLALGVPPGGSAAIATECGMVRVDAVASPRREELTIASLRRALADATRELGEHNVDYHHSTPREKLDGWRRLAAGDPVAEAVARVDEGKAAGR